MSKKNWEFIKQNRYFLVTLILLLGIVLLLSTYADNFKDWTGFPSDKIPSDVNVIPVKVYQGSKTLWDWLQLLLIPLILAVAAYFLNESQQKRQHRIEQDKQFQSTLDAYFDRMTTLLFEKKLKESTPESEIRTLARTLSLTALKNVDGKRKGQIIQFLYESKLIFKGKERTIVYLDNADLSDANLRGLHLDSVLLGRCNLNNADFRGSWLKNTNLSQSNLYKASLSSVPLDNATLDMVILSNADLEGAMLWGTSCVGTHFENANLKKTMLGDAQYFLVSENEILTEEKKRSYDAVFSFDNGDFSANLSEADLTGAKIGNYQLKFVCLKNTKMPDGEKYEKWLKKQEKEFQEERKSADLKWKEIYENSKKKIN